MYNQTRPDLMPIIGLCAASAVLVACDTVPEAAAPAAMLAEAEAPDLMAHNMVFMGYHDLQARSAYQPVVHTYADGRRILFVGLHAGSSMNDMNGQDEVNGLAILDVTDPVAPQLLRHLPPNNPDANGTQHVQICNGSDLPNGDPARVYAARTDGLLGWWIGGLMD